MRLLFDKAVLKFFGKFQEKNICDRTHEVFSLISTLSSYWLEGSYKSESDIHPSILLSGSFLGIGLLVFSENQYGVRGPCIVAVHDSQIFQQKNVLSQKWGKWVKNRVFWIYWKI